MVRLGEESPYRKEHPFIVQKKANATLPSQVRIGKVAHINSGLALLPAPGTSIAQLEEHCEKLALAFGTCRIERNEKWAKYLVRNVPRRICTTESLEEVTAEIAVEAFEQSCNMRPEWARWLIPQGVDKDELVEASMIFAVRPVNIHSIPKVISLLDAMHVVIALPAKESPIQCVKCGEWGRKKENCAKRARCYHCSREKHSFSIHKCEEDDCKDGNPPCPQLLQIKNPWLEDKIGEVKKTLRKVVKHSERLYYQTVVSDLDSKTVFKVMKWLNSIRKYTTPPIELVDGTLATSNQEKQYALKKALLTPPITPDVAELEPIVNLETESKNLIANWKSLTLQEVELAGLHTGNTSPGVDEIPPAIVRTCWLTYQKEITWLFSLCLKEGYHPTAFKTAILCALPKDGNRPKHLPR